jgi:peptidoglycan L-alanyl-D-glutamate endopeptidase CwlK
MDFKNYKKKNVLIFFIGGLSIYLMYKFFTRNFEKAVEDMEESKNEKKVWDSNSDKLIDKLHPAIRDKARAFINEAERQGLKLKVTSTLRDYDEQNKLYAQGRTTKGQVVTNARGGYSWHNFGNALDIAPIENGKANYNTKNWKKISSIGKSFGFEWGGDWKKFVDKPHFQIVFGLTTAQARAKKSKNQVDNDGYILV